MARLHHLVMLCVCALTMASATSATVNASSSVAPNALCILQALDYEPEDLLSESRLAALFDAWNHKHGKVYRPEVEPGTTSPEKERRFQIFKENLQYIHEHNSKGQSSFTLGLTRFADLTNEEFKASSIFGAGQLGEVIGDGISESRYGHMLGSCDTSGLPASVDWREKGVVVGVKDQGQCGSCWAFSAVGAIESAHAIATGSLVRLSEQQLVSCDTSNSGCIGGWMDRAFGWVDGNGGISSEADYPYTSGGGTAPPCRTDQLKNIAVSISSYVRLASFDESALQCAVGAQPVSAALSASGRDFQLYTGGVFDVADCPTAVDHAVIVEGWGISNGVEYWIARNSWGAWWGCEGYIYLAKGKHLPKGICGLHTRSSFPIAVPAPQTKCTDGIYCLAKQTCCCVSEVGSACTQWGCCPEGFPICIAGACYRQGASSLEMLQLHAPAKNQLKPTLPIYKDPQFSSYELHASQ